MHAIKLDIFLCNYTPHKMTKVNKSRFAQVWLFLVWTPAAMNCQQLVLSFFYDPTNIPDKISDTGKLLPKPRPHTRIFFKISVDSASVHTPSGESGIRIRNVSNPLSAPEWKFLNIQRNRNRVDANPEKFLIQWRNKIGPSSLPCWCKAQ